MYHYTSRSVILSVLSVCPVRGCSSKLESHPSTKVPDGRRVWFL